MIRAIKKSEGNIGDVLTMGLLVLSIAVVVMRFMDCMELMRIREDVSQISREYILIAETTGYISEAEKNEMLVALSKAGLSDINLEGTTFSQVGFGNLIKVQIKGKAKGLYEINEIRESTAKY